MQIRKMELVIFTIRWAIYKPRDAKALQIELYVPTAPTPSLPDLSHDAKDHPIM